MMILKMRVNWQKKEVSLEGHAMNVPEDPLDPMAPNARPPRAREFADRKDSIFYLCGAF